jgi:hypothetical protein
MNPQDVLRIILPVIDVLDQLGVAYRVVESVASSFRVD